MQKYRAYDTDIYVEEGSLASVRLLQSSKLAPLSKFISNEGKVRSIINCSFFTPQYVLGRNQGDERNDTHNDSEVFYDVVILKDGTFKAGKMNSWDYQNNVVCGFTAPALLMRNGQDVEELSTFYSRSVLTAKHPRTAFAILKDGKCIQLVTEGRGFRSSVGMTGFEVRDFLKTLYKNIDTLAILDGGGSSEMIVDGEIINYPTDGKERPMLNGIAFISKEQPKKQEEVKVMGNQIPFLPRLIREGMSGNKFYYDQNENPYADNETGLPNCVTFAMGRSGELAGQTVRWELLDPQHKGLGHGMYPNAQLWYSRAHWAKGGTPKLGAILVFGGGQYGHVAIVEEIYGDGRILVSQSNFTRDKSKMNANVFQTMTIDKPIVGKVNKQVGLTFLGYLYNPHVVDIRESRNDKKDQVQIKVDQLKVRDDSHQWYTGRYAAKGIYSILATKQKDGLTWAKIHNNMWIALNDKDGWTITYKPQVAEPKEEKPSPAPVPAEPQVEEKKEDESIMDKEKALEDLKNALKQATEKVAELEKAESDKETKIAEQEKELQELRDFKKKIKEMIV